MGVEKGGRNGYVNPPLFVYSLGLIFQGRIRKILRAHGWKLKLGFPIGKKDAVAVWGRKKVAKRGIFVARLFGKSLITVEDAFLRSVLTGRQGGLSMGIVTDAKGIYFDTNNPSDIDELFDQASDLTPEKTQAAYENMMQLKSLNLSKYNNYSNKKTDLPDNFILLVDQTYKDAAVVKAGANSNTFKAMLEAAKQENPDYKILIKTHPETIAGKRSGYYSHADCDDQVSLLSEPISPWVVFNKAAKIYCVTSQLGLEAIFSGHKPIVFGNAFYCGLGLTDDRSKRIKRNKKPLSAVQLFWATHLQYSRWYDPYFDRATDFSNLSMILHAQTRQFQENSNLAHCIGMRLWKRGFLRRYLSGNNGGPLFYKDQSQALQAAKSTGGRILVWANKETDNLVYGCDKADIPLIRVEDGFLRSVGLGASLVVPTSLAFDDLGIYYDPTKPSRLEYIINTMGTLTDKQCSRANQLQQRLISLKMTKYNLTNATIQLPTDGTQEIVLVPGQVEDDASILKGADTVKTNFDLLQATRRDFPNAYIVYKPHPDVEAGLRNGAIPTQHATKYADIVVDSCDMASLLEQVDRVATITSLTGFEALIRGKSVTCYGRPFYFGWGLTDDRIAKIDRRTATPTMAELIHACLIEYPRYWDPVTHAPCPVETVLERFEKGQMVTKSGPHTKILAKLQGIFASYAHIWR